jgi:hypothetical protein
MLAKSISYIWDISVDKALVKTAQIMINSTAGSELSSKLMNAEMKAVVNKVEMLHSYTTSDQLELAIAEIESLINMYATRGQLDESQVMEIETSMSYILNNHPSYKSKLNSPEFDTLFVNTEIEEGANEAVNAQHDF